MQQPLFHMKHTLTLMAGMNALGSLTSEDVAASIRELQDAIADIEAAIANLAPLPDSFVRVPVMTLAQLAAQAGGQRRFAVVEGGVAS